MISSINKNVKKLALVLFLLSLAACVTVTPEKPMVVNGAVGYLEKIMLPQNSQLTIAIVDLGNPQNILAQKNFQVVRMPVPFKFQLPKSSINRNANYGVVAMIKYQNKVIFRTYEQFPVINNGKTTTEVLMKAVY